MVSAPAGCSRVSVALLCGLALCFVLAVEVGLLLYGDLAKLWQVRQGPLGVMGVRHREPTGPGRGGAAGGAGGPAPSLPLLPKVALMFLTRGPMPLEPIWADFLAAAGTAVQAGHAADGSNGNSSSIGGGGSPAAGREGGSGAGTRGAWTPEWPQRAPWETLFSLYAHPPPGFAYPNSSLFAGREVEGRAEVEWGQHSVVEAERALLRAALADPLNHRFVLLSESCIPLYPPATIYWQLMAETKSRVNACCNVSDPGDAQRRMDYRWVAAMAVAGVTKEQWRKSSQWKSLTRRHAEAVAADANVSTVFAKECWSERRQPIRRFCVSDEHYVPTLLAHLGLEGEADCGGVITHTLWDGPYFHPRTYSKKEASERTLAKLRGEGCVAPEAWGPAARQALAHLLQQLQAQQRRAGANNGQGAAVSSSSGRRGLEERTVAAATGGQGGRPAMRSTVVGGQEEAVRWAFRTLGKVSAALNVSLLASTCPLFARKVAGDGAAEWGRLLQPVLVQRRRV